MKTIQSGYATGYCIQSSCIFKHVSIRDCLKEARAIKSLVTIGTVLRTMAAIRCFYGPNSRSSLEAPFICLKKKVTFFILMIKQGLWKHTPGKHLMIKYKCFKMLTSSWHWILLWYTQLNFRIFLI